MMFSVKTNIRILLEYHEGNSDIVRVNCVKRKFYRDGAKKNKL